MPTAYDKSLLAHSENALCEQPSIDLFDELGWQTVNCFAEFDHGRSSLGRTSKGEVVLVARLRAALVKLNPDLPADAIQLAIDELTRDRSAMSPANANRDVYRLLKDGVKVAFRGGESGDEEIEERVQVIDWLTPQVHFAEELQKGNVAVGIVVAAIFVSIALIVGQSLN